MKIAVITGCNKGLGLRLLERFSEEGYNVIALNRKQYDDFDEKIVAIVNKYGNSITPVYADLTDEAAIEEATKKIEEMEVSIDVLVNNAGTNVTMNIFNTEYSDIERIFKTNFFAPLMITKGISSLMIREGKGVIINISSIMSLHPNAGLSCYGASKAALNYFTSSVGYELAPFGIRINTLACGPIETPMYKSLDEKVQRKMLKRVPLGRLLELNEVADMVLFLVSDKATYMTGSIIPYGGGLN